MGSEMCIRDREFFGAPKASEPHDDAALPVFPRSVDGCSQNCVRCGVWQDRFITPGERIFPAHDACWCGLSAKKKSHEHRVDRSKGVRKARSMIICTFSMPIFPFVLGVE